MAHCSKLLTAALLTAVAAVIVLPYGPVAFGQGITTGTIKGTVVDPSGALVANANVTATSDARGTQIVTSSGAKGEFSLYTVSVGTYTVSISAAGFSTTDVKDVLINAGATSTLDGVKLAVGAATQVEVNASASTLLQTSDSQVTTTFSAQTIQSLPLNNGFDTLAELIPGVVSTHGDGFSNANGDNYSVHGQSGRYNNSEIDGQSNNDNDVGGPQIFFGNQDAIQEIQVITNNFSAQYGRNSGAVVNYITKSGTNAFHGSGFDTYQSQFLSSLQNQQKSPAFGYCAPGQNPSSGCAVPSLPRFVENRYGGTLGGPILKERLFFFASTYWDRVRQGASPTASLPYLTPDPTGITQLGTAFPGNPAVAAITTNGPYSVKAGNPQPIPVPAGSCPGTPGANGSCVEVVNGPGGAAANVEFAGIQRNIASLFNDQEHLGRLDFQPTSRDHLFARYFYQNELLTGFGGGEPGQIANGDFLNVTDVAHTIGADWTHTFSERWVDQLRYSFQQTKGYFQGGSYPNCTTTNDAACPTQLSFLGGNDDMGFGVNANYPQGRTVKVTQIQNNATWTRGNHTVVFGGEFDYQNSPIVGLGYYNGNLNYQTFGDFLQNGASGQAYALLADGDLTIPLTEPDAAGYVQDDWKVTPNFTAHIGLRWEFFGQALNKLHDLTVARETNPATAFWDQTLPLSARTDPEAAEYYKGFQPRLGFAWNPDFDKKVVVTGGYAIDENPAYYNLLTLASSGAPMVNFGLVPCVPGQTCLPANGSLLSTDVRATNLPSLPKGAGVDPRVRFQTYFPTNFRPPYVQTYTLAIQHQIGRAAVGEARYVGSKTTHDFQSVNHNPFLGEVAEAFPNLVSPSSLCQDPTANGTGRPNCDYSNESFITNGGWANYNGLLLNLTTQNYHGLTMTASYTRSKNLSNTTDGFRSTGGAGSSIAYAQNPLDTSAGERGLSGNDFPNVVALFYNYQIPKLAVSGLLSRLTNGFALSGIYRFNSGQVYTPFQGITLDANTGDSSFCDGDFNSQSVGGDTCRLVISNRKAPLNSVAYLNPYTGPLVKGTPTLGTPEYVVYNSDGFITDPTSGAVTGYNPGTPTDPKSSYWIIDNQAYAMAVGNPYPGSGRSPLRGQTFSCFDTTITKTTQLTERIQIQLSLSAYNALNQMYLPSNIATAFVGSSSFTQTLFSTSGSSAGSGFSSGNRFVLLGGKIVF